MLSNLDSHSGSSADLTKACLALSWIVGIPRGHLSSLPGFGIHTLLSALALRFPLMFSAQVSLCSGDIALVKVVRT
ncbi:hypothetical protein AAEJ74_28785, partial [Limnospira fusiformis PMC 851.14]